jgi:hypothetical protein
MKVKVNIREHIEDNADHNDMLLVHASVDVDELFDTNSIPEEAEIDVDIHELLAENRQIAHIWGIDDVRQQRPDLDEEQAWAVLQLVEEKLDCNVGITCEIVERIADVLYPEKRQRRWQGRIDVSVDNYDRVIAIEHFEEMAAHVERDAVNSTTRATFDPASLRPVEPGETTSK